MLKAMAFLSFAKKVGNKYGKKRVVQKAAKATGVLVGNKIADKIISVGKTKSKEKGDETNKKQEIYILPEKNTANYR